MVEVAPRVAVIIINYNGKKWLSRCLSSVAKVDYPNFSVYLVDNASIDGSVDFVKERFPAVKIIKHDMNYGFAKGYNLAIKQVNAKYVALLNNDTELLGSNWLEIMVRVAEEDNLIAAVSCKMVFISNPAILNSVGNVGIPYWRGAIDMGFGQTDVGQFDHPPIEPFSFSGGAALIRKDIFNKAGGFDDDFFAFSEDTDLSWRFRMMGYRVAYAPEAKIAHRFSGTWFDVPEKTYLCKRNLLRSILKNCAEDVLLRWALPCYVLFTLLASLSYILVERAPLMALAMLNSILWNVWHFRDTFHKRVLSQMLRKTSDEPILDKMYPSGLTWRHGPDSFGARVADHIFGSLPEYWAHRIGSFS